MRICVVGAGAIGGVIAAQLATAEDTEVSVLARGATLAALASDGLRVTTAAGTAVMRPTIVSSGPAWQGPLVHSGLTASDDAAALGVQDVVVVAVKAQSMRSV